MQSESFRAFNPSLSGVFNEPMSNISPDGFFSDNSDKIPAETSIGVATIITSKSIPASRQSEYECVSFWIFLSATNVSKPWDLKKSIALGVVKGRKNMMCQKLIIPMENKQINVTVADPVFLDKENKRLNA